jgi:hypothetical protein
VLIAGSPWLGCRFNRRQRAVHAATPVRLIIGWSSHRAASSARCSSPASNALAFADIEPKRRRQPGDGDCGRRRSRCRSRSASRVAGGMLEGLQASCRARRSTALWPSTPPSLSWRPFGLRSPCCLHPPAAAMRAAPFQAIGSGDVPEAISAQREASSRPRPPLKPFASR